jgi:hypothetical protein
MKSKSLRGSIDRFCKSCLYDPREVAALGGWRAQVEACSSTGCPLHAVRPRPRAEGVSRKAPKS